MNAFTKIIAQIPFIRPVPKNDTSTPPGDGLSLKKKKRIMIEAIHEVEGVFSQTFDISRDEELLKLLQIEYKEVFERRHNAVEKLRNVETNIKFAVGKIEHLTKKSIEIGQKTVLTETLKKDCLMRLGSLETEESLQSEVSDLKNVLTNLEEDTSASTKKLEVLETEQKSVTELKDSLTQELKSVNNKIGVQENQKVTLESRKEELNENWRILEEILESLVTIETEKEDLIKSLDDLEPKTNASNEEVEQLKKKRTDIQDQLGDQGHKKEGLTRDIQELEGREAKIEELNEALGKAGGEKDETQSMVSSLTEKLALAGKDKGELDAVMRETQQEIDDIQQKKSELQNKSKPVLDVLNQREVIEESYNSDKERFEKLSQEAENLRNDMRINELELHHYRAAVKEIQEAFSVDEHG